MTKKSFEEEKQMEELFSNIFKNKDKNDENLLLYQKQMQFLVEGRMKLIEMQSKLLETNTYIQSKQKSIIDIH